LEIEGLGHVGTFRVEEYKSPEFEVKVDAPAEPQILGDTIEAVVRADYFSVRR
jgi:alpha-2-macroglobulin